LARHVRDAILEEGIKSRPAVQICHRHQRHVRGNVAVAALQGALWIALVLDIHAPVLWAR
jgi:hypothetical protein